ncbi:MAG: hypothetical protein IPQ07_15100 [Myxococcales bacterium]|nr:hypothetical protein [Myxococcales bacterium]
MTTGRMHARSLVTASRPAAQTDQLELELLAPAPGMFRTAVHVGDVVRPGEVLGALEVLGQVIELVAPQVGGAVVALREPHLARTAVEHGAVLVTLDPRASASTAAAVTTEAASLALGLVFRAPTSGRFYGRSAPDKPVFVTVGDELVPGATVCLLEVMKTFHRVTYGGANLPERARVRELLVSDGADVTAGDPLLALEPA